MKNYKKMSNSIRIIIKAFESLLKHTLIKVIFLLLIRSRIKKVTHTKLKYLENISIIEALEFFLFQMVYPKQVKKLC